MIIVAGTVRIDTSKLDATRGEMKKMLDGSRAEDGCVEYSYAIDVLDSGLVHVFEIWRDRAALDRHFQTTHMAEWRQSFPAIGISDRKLKIYDVSGSAPI
ncbi:MAG: putative quinol monooxygenase [Micropepsaceae bacterium]